MRVKYILFGFFGGIFLLSSACTRQSDIDDTTSDRVYPNSISIISSSTVKMGLGQTRTIDFRVNPSDANFNYDVESLGCEIGLDYLGANTRSGYVTAPTHVTLTKVEPMYDANNNKLQGQYRAFVTDQRELKKYDDRLGLVLTVPGQSGNQVQISSSAINVVLCCGEITSFMFKMTDNPTILQENLQCSIYNNLINGRIPHIVNDKKLIPEIQFEGEGKLVLHSTPEQSISSLTDFSSPVVYDVIDEGTKEILDSYEVNISAFTGLPVIWIYTEGRAEITSKEEYLRATFKLINSSNNDTIETALNIKGRGNTTWGYPKKPYALKFDDKISLLNEPRDKSWVLLANYFDKSMIRNMLAFYLGSISKLKWTPRSHFVELMLNGRYNGTYQLTEKIKISNNRVNAGDDGFLLEIDHKAINEDDAIVFYTPKLPQPVNIKEPDDIVVDDPNYNYIKDFVLNAEEVLYSDAFLDPVNGYRSLFDVESFVDYMVVSEIIKNADTMHSSNYFYLKRGGKLVMGPLWDYDLSCGNSLYSPHPNTTEGFVIFDNSWFGRMCEDPEFLSAAKERFYFYYNQKDEIMRFINDNAHYLHYSVIENDNKWGILNAIPRKDTPSNFEIWGSYDNEVQRLKEWLNARFEWLKTAIDNM